MDRNPFIRSELMCGIAGIVSHSDRDDLFARIRKMNNALEHRGPDDEGEAAFRDGDLNVMLGHRRLAIIDLSPGGRQPKTCNNGRFTIIFNGELYNYKKLRFDLSRAISGSSVPPYHFKTDSDTEVVLAAWTAWGPDCLKRFEGMFAFALWDDRDKKLFLVRDRLGKKPLYYTEQDGHFIFASEIRALLASGLVKPQLNRESLYEYYRYQTVHAPYTLLSNVRMLMPGSCLERSSGQTSIASWWDINGRYNALSGELKNRKRELVEKEVRKLLLEAVEKRLVCDVPFGAFLSGGIDSSVIVGLMATIAASRVKTFSVVFDDSEFSEDRYSGLVAEKFKTEHHRILLKPEVLLESLPEILSDTDHPGGDGPNTWVVARATKAAGITMALSGVGGDELFGGYGLFRRLMDLRRKIIPGLVPQSGRKLAGSAIAKLRRDAFGQKAAELLSVPAFSLRHLYPVQRAVFARKMTAQLLSGPTGRDGVEDIAGTLPEEAGRIFSSISMAEIQTYLQNVLLRDTDNMSMAHALEVRAPFLDHHLVEYVLALGDESKPLQPSKELLIRAAADLLPAEIINRPKMGFTFPWGRWMRTELKEFCSVRLESLSERDFTGTVSPSGLWTKFIKGDKRVPWSRLWHLVTLEDWIQRNKIDA